MTFLPLKASESDVARHYSRNMREPTRIEYIRDKVSLACVRQINARSSYFSISLSFYGNRVLSGSPSGACLWDADSGEPIREPTGGDERVAFAYPESSIVVVYRDGAIDEWGADTCERMHGLPTVDIGHIISVSIDHWKYYATGFEDGAIQLWDRRGKIAIREPLRGHSEKVRALLFNVPLKDHCLASGSDDPSIIIWNVERREMKYPPLKAHSGPITSLVFTYQSEHLVSGSLDGTVRL